MVNRYNIPAQQSARMNAMSIMHMLVLLYNPFGTEYFFAKTIRPASEPPKINTKTAMSHQFKKLASITPVTSLTRLSILKLKTIPLIEYKASFAIDKTT